jgi:hypothetical protein
MLFAHPTSSLPIRHLSPLKLLREACAVAFGKHIANRQVDIDYSRVTMQQSMSRSAVRVGRNQTPHTVLCAAGRVALCSPSLLTDEVAVRSPLLCSSCLRNGGHIQNSFVQ